jgi:hypothetical protein
MDNAIFVIRPFTEGMAVEAFHCYEELEQEGLPFIPLSPAQEHPRDSELSQKDTNV